MDKVARPLSGPRPKTTSEGKQTSFRHEVVRVHKEIHRRNRKRISESVLGYTQTFRTYEEEYHAAIQTYQCRAKLEELDRALARTNLVYFGDYHTLKQAQRSFLRLVRRIPKERPVTLAIEMLQHRHQKHIDAFLGGTLSEATFLEAIEFDPEDMFGNWETYREIFELARERNYRVLGIDASRTRGSSGPLDQRDAFAARRLAREHHKYPDHLIVTLIGEMHIAPVHLPRALDEVVTGKGRPKPERVIIYQNAEQVYWHLQERGREHNTELVRVAAGQYCIINTPPIVCQQSFLNWLDADDITQPIDTVEANFKRFARLVSDFFDLDVGSRLDDIEVATVVDLSFLQRLRRRGDFTPSDMQQIRAQVLSSESYYIPSASMVYLGNLSINHASEEATHFLRHICSGMREPKHLVDAFYARALEEAIGFLGSKLINHKRKCTHLSTFEKIKRSRSASPQAKQLARMVVKHAALVRGERVRGMSEIYECGVELFNQITHVIGYELGDKLFYSLMDGMCEKNEIRDLFFDHFEEEGSALTTYFQLAIRVQNIDVPERL